MGQLPSSYAAGSSGHLGHHAQIAEKLNASLDVNADFGATGDGTTDDTGAIQDAIDAATDGSTLSFPKPASAYRVTSTLLFEDLERLNVRFNSSTIRWEGNATDPMIRVFGCRDCTFEEFYWLSSSAFPLEVACVLETRSGSVSTRNRFVGGEIQGTGAGGLDWGFRVITGTGGDNNNDFMWFENVTVRNYDDAAFYVGHAQAKHQMFMHCHFNPGAAAGVTGLDLDLGSFSWIGGSGGANDIDFDLGVLTDSCTIQDFTGEDSGQFIATGGATTSEFPLLVMGNKWTANAIGAHLKVCDFKHPGPIVMTANKIHGGSSWGANVIAWNPSGATGGLVAVGNHIDSSAVDPFSGTRPTVQFGNSIDRGAARVRLPSHGVGAFAAFADADASPSVSAGNLFTTANTGATSITTFDDGFEGQEIEVHINDANTTLVDGATLHLNGTTNWAAPSGSTLRLRKRGTAWREVGRMAR